MVKCSFCGNKLPEGRGKMFVLKSGQVRYFCNSKCQKNWKKGREGKNTEWTKTAREGK